MKKSRALTRLAFLVKRWLDRKASTIDHNEVLKSIYLETNISSSYFLLIVIANLIALSGLITNSSPVIIGAMLISPLMSPVLNIGFAFITGDKFVWETSLKKIAAGVGLTLLTAGIASYLSPLKNITAKSPAVNVSVEAYTGTYDDRRKLSELAKQRIRSVVQVLVDDCGIPREAIHAAVTKSRKIEAPAVKVAITLTGGNS